MRQAAQLNQDFFEAFYLLAALEAMSGQAEASLRSLQEAVFGDSRLVAASLRLSREAAPDRGPWVRRSGTLGALPHRHTYLWCKAGPAACPGAARVSKR